MTQPINLPHIKHYVILSEADPVALQTRVETEIHNGLQPYGILLVDRFEDTVVYMQAMVRYAEFAR